MMTHDASEMTESPSHSELRQLLSWAEAGESVQVIKIS